MAAITRSTGIVAMALMVLSLLWGFLFSSRATGKRLRPNWWLDLHIWLGGLALIFTIVHIVASLLDTNSGIGLVEVFVPRLSAADRSITWGVLLLALTAISFGWQRLKPWRRGLVRWFRRGTGRSTPTTSRGSRTAGTPVSRQCRLARRFRRR